jgi:hypothetical protein
MSNGRITGLELERNVRNGRYAEPTLFAVKPTRRESAG